MARLLLYIGARRNKKSKEEVKMIIGCPKEAKSGETRIALTPDWTRTLTNAGHEVLIQAGGGLACGFTDEDYMEAGAKIEKDIKDIYGNSEFVVKVKELQPSEYDLLQKDQVVMAWFHLAEDVDHPMLEALLEKQVTGIGMELIVLPDGTRPTIKPMSEIAGSLAMLEAIKYGQYIHGGPGILYRKLSGIPAPRVLILGGGHAGLCAAEIALGLGLQVTIVEKYWPRIAQLRYMIPGADVIYWEEENVYRLLRECDVLLNTIYPMPNQPCLITRDHVKSMKKDAILIDIVGVGVVETMTYTTLEDPIYYEEGHLHYNVPNMPALTPKTSTNALLLASGPYILDIANKGLKKACKDDPALFNSISTCGGKVVHQEVGDNHQQGFTQFSLDMLP